MVETGPRLWSMTGLAIGLSPKHHARMNGEERPQGGTILIADDHPLFRQAMTMAAERAAPGCTIVEAATLDGALVAAGKASDLRLILLDLKMPGATGYSGVAMLHAERPTVPILVVSSAEGAAPQQEVRRFGAVGFIGKEQDLDSIEAAIADALSGAVMGLPLAADEGVDDMAVKVATLTPTQLRVLLGVLAGRLNKQIAYDLAITEATVKAHMTAVMAKLGVQNRTQAALAARYMTRS